MDPAVLLGMVVSLITFVVVACGSLLSVAVSVAVPLAIVWMVFKRLSAGGAIVVSGPLVQGFVPAHAPAPAPKGPTYVKRTRCRACGAPKVTRSLSAYVYCDFCGALADWDFQACLADRRSRLPGPTYEALLHTMRDDLARTKAQGDRPAYEQLQVRIFDAYATACPAALPPRIGDPRFRKDFVAWSAASQTSQDLHPTTVATFNAQQAAVQGLVWDRSNPFSPKVEPGSFWRMMDAVRANQEAAMNLIEQDGLFERHPDRPDRALFLRMGLSAMVQGWMPYLPPGESERLLDSTGLRDAYDAVEPPPTRGGACPGCGAPLTVVEGAKRVVCHGCGHMVGVGAGRLSCHGCGSPVDVPEHAALFACGACEAELRILRSG